MFSNKILQCLRELPFSLSLSLLSYITLPLNPSISLQKAVLPLSKVPGH